LYAPNLQGSFYPRHYLNRTGNVRVTLALRRVRATVVAVEK